MVLGRENFGEGEFGMANFHRSHLRPLEHGPLGHDLASIRLSEVLNSPACLCNRAMLGTVKRYNFTWPNFAHSQFPSLRYQSCKGCDSDGVGVVMGVGRSMGVMTVGKSHLGFGERLSLRIAISFEPLQTTCTADF